MKKDMTTTKKSLANKGKTWLDNWLRWAADFDSHLSGYSKYDVDQVWEGPNKTRGGQGLYMYFEEKSHMATVPLGQLIMMRKVILGKEIDTRFCGYHIIQYNEDPQEENQIWIDGDKTDFLGFINFLQFKNAILGESPLTQLINGEKKDFEEVKNSFFGIRELSVAEKQGDII